MLGSTVPATPSLHTSTSSATPTSPTRSGRLRGLSYLRNYTRDHLTGSLGGRSDIGDISAVESAGNPLQEGASRLGFGITAHHNSRAGPGRRRATEGAESTEEERLQNIREVWLPTVQGRSVSRPLHPSQSSNFASPEPNTNNTGLSFDVGMTRSRAASAQLGPTLTSPPPNTSAIRAAGSSNRRPSHVEGMLAAQNDEDDTQLAQTTSKDASTQPTIRFIPHIEPRSTRPSLQFTAVTRALASATSVVRVGRYSERDTANHTNTSPHSTTPVGFKSKVVSRRHCEFSCTNGQWYIKDVKSSSGTFLNHVRLSPPGAESRPFPVNDGDVVQLGIDFKGGEEVIFRCVKIRIECNRGWQKKVNEFNRDTHKRLLKTAGNANGGAKAKGRDIDETTNTNSSECSICLNPVAPCQALFVAPCSHVWHFKCIRNLIHGPNWPNFLCPNCRFVADLEADVEAPEDWEIEAQEMIHDHDHNHNHQDELAEDEDAQQGAEDDSEHFHDAVPASSSNNTGGLSQFADEELAEFLTHTAVNPRSRARNGHQQQQLHITNPNQEEEVEAEGDETQMSIEASNSSSTSQPVDIANSGRLTNESETDLLSPRSATPTSSAQFALAAGVMNMNGSGSASRRSGGSKTSREEAEGFAVA